MTTGIVSGAWGAALVTAYRAAAPPVLDGALQEPCWQQATVCGPFLPASGNKLDARTTAYLAWDDNNLYVAFECFDRFLQPMVQQTDKVKAERKDHDSNVFSDDCVEIFLDMPGGSSFQLAANSIGTRWEARDGEVGWNGEWRAAAVRRDDRYIVECAIPLASLGAGKLPGSTWRANFCRERSAVAENSTWSGLQGAFNDRAQFGRVVFAESGPVVHSAEITAPTPDRRRVVLEVSSPAPAPGLECALDLYAGAKKLGQKTLPASLTPGQRGRVEGEFLVPPEAVQAGQLGYEWALRAGNVVYASSPRQTESLAISRGEFALSQAPGVQCQAFLDGKPVAAGPLELHDGLNLVTLITKGRGWVKPEITIGRQKIAADARWFCLSKEPPAAWQTEYVPGFAPAPAVKGQLQTPEGTAYYRRGLWVSSPAGRLFPLTNKLWLPVGTSQRVKPYLTLPTGLPTEGYRLCMQVPDYLRYVTAEPTEGAQPAEVTRQQVAPGQSVYGAQYPLLPGRGLELSLRWVSKDGGTIGYQPGLQAGGTFDWRRLSGTFKAPEGAGQLHPLVIKWQDRDIIGTFWVDNITVRRKGSTDDLLKVGDFEGPDWADGRIKPGYGNNGTKGLKIVCLPEQVKGQNALWIPKKPVVNVEPGVEYIIEMDAKAENLVSGTYKPMGSLLFSVDNKAPQGSDQMLVYFETGGGNITEVAQPVAIEVLPPLLGVRPKHIKTTPCYYSEQFSNPQVLSALADNFWRSGMIANYGSADNEVVRQLRQRGSHESILSLGYSPFSPPRACRDLLTDRPEVAAVEYPNKPSKSRLCPTWMLNEAPEVLKALEDDMAQAVSNGKYQGADIDVEDPVIDPPTYCFCPRCFAAFARQAGLPDDTKLTPEMMTKEYRDKWTAFRCGQNAQLVKHIGLGVKRGCPGIEFSVYSGTQGKYTMEHYGVDWKLMAPYLDLGIAGYGGARGAVQETVKALAPVPFMGGEMYYLSNTSADSAAPNPLTWRNRLLRQCLDSGGVGVLIWWLPVMDGGAFYYTSEAAAVLARYEEIFSKGQRCDADVKVDGLPRNDWFAFQLGKDRLVLLLNFKNEPVKPVVALPQGWRQTSFCDPVTGKALSGSELEIPAYGVRVIRAVE
ncbi:MAG: sugar-binding protein [Armatimonadia bacterium]